MKRGILRRLYVMVSVGIALLLPMSYAKAQDVRVSLDMKDVALEKVLGSIESQTRYLFSPAADVNVKQIVTIQVSNAELREVLSQLRVQTGLDFSVENATIYITKPKLPSSRTVHGKVIDVTALPVPGVSVFIKGTTIGTTTDLDGLFSLTVPGDLLGGRLVFSSIGYSDVEISIGNRRTFDVTLQESAVELEATVVTALGIRRDQKALSYNVQEVKSDQVTTVKDANFINSLSGKVAGVTINASSSGVGGASKVVLRGNKSISQSSNALYVIPQNIFFYLTAKYCSKITAG